MKIMTNESVGSDLVDTPNNQLGKGSSILTPTLQNARIEYPLFYQDNKKTPTSPLQYNICKISLQRAKRLNQLWHSRLPIYETGFCEKAKICFGALYKGIFYAVAIWDNPTARMLSQDTWLELKRMAIAPDAPKYTASRMLAIMIKLIKKKFPEVEKVISYQDEEVHAGTIYKAVGWSIGSHHKGGSWSRPNSKNTYNNKPRIRPDLNKALGPKIRWEKEI